MDQITRKRFFDVLQKNKPRFKTFKWLRKDYLFDSHIRENVEMGVGIEETGITARFVLRGRLKSELASVATDLKLRIHKEPKTLQQEKKDKASVLFKLNFDIYDESKWSCAHEWADKHLDEFFKFFVEHRISFRGGYYP